MKTQQKKNSPSDRIEDDGNIENLEHQNQTRDQNLNSKIKNKPDTVNSALLSLMIIDGDDKTRN